jgi:nucleotide-binding universal stress UspA family protein
MEANALQDVTDGGVERPADMGRGQQGGPVVVDGQLDKAAETEQKGDVVVVAVDETQRSEEAFDWYVENIHEPNNKVLVIYAVAPASSGDQRKANGSMSVREKFERKMATANFSNVSQFISEVSSKPGEFIVLTAADADANMIVVGSRGMGRLLRTISGGSVSSFVLQNAHCPVVVCRHCTK